MSTHVVRQYTNSRQFYQKIADDVNVKYLKIKVKLFGVYIAIYRLIIKHVKYSKAGTAKIKYFLLNIYLDCIWDTRPGEIICLVA